MDFLLDFLNVKEWNPETLRSMWFSGPSSIIPYIGTEYRPKGLPDSKKVRIKLEQNHSLSCFDRSSEDHVIFAEAPECLPFYNYLAELQKEWVERIKDTMTNGPDRFSLNFLSRDKMFVELKNTDDPWKLDIILSAKPLTLESLLFVGYIQPFVNGKGELYRRIRTCQKPDCCKWFVYNRPKQVFCCDKCRLDFHNAKYIKNGKAAAYMKQARDNGRYQ